MDNIYYYDGPVTSFDKVIKQSWYGQTIAPSERKARSNLTFQFKRQNGLMPGFKIELPGKLVTEG